MGSTWHSAILRGPSDEDLARVVAECLFLAKGCDEPAVRLHVRRPTGGIANGLVSLEMTRFWNRDPRFASSELELLSSQVFGDTGLRFHLPNVLIAQRASELLHARAVCLDYSDTYCSAGYVGFDGGRPYEYEIAGWDGSNTWLSLQEGLRRSGEQDEQEPYRTVHAVLARASACLQVQFGDIDEVFDAFCGEHSAVQRYLLVEERRILDTPRLIEVRT